MTRFASAGPLRLVTGLPDLQLLDTWCLWMQGRGLADRTVTDRRRIVLQLCREQGCDPLSLTAPSISTWLSRLPKHTDTRATYLAAIRAWCRWLVETGHRPDDPSIAVGKPRLHRRHPRPAANEHLQAVLASGIRFTTRVKIELCAYQGLRVHEVAKVNGQDLDLVANTIKVVGKGSKVAVLPLHEIIRERAQVMPKKGLWFPSPIDPTRPVRRDSVSNAISDAFARIGSDATAHQLRHWFGTTLLEHGTDIRVVQEMMRHDSLATTALYTRVGDAQKRKAIRTLPTLGQPEVWS